MNRTFYVKNLLVEVCSRKGDCYYEFIMTSKKTQLAGISKKVIVFVALETTGFSTSNCELLMIAAWSEPEEEFSQFVMPNGEIKLDVGGFVKQGDRLLHKGEEVPNPVSEEKAVHRFIRFLESHDERVVLVSHILEFHLRVLVEAAKRAGLGLYKRLKNAVEGGVCTATMSENAFKMVEGPEEPTFANLAKFFLGQSYTVDDRDGRVKTKALRKIYLKLGAWCKPETCSETMENFIKRNNLILRKKSFLVDSSSSDEN